MIVYFNNGFIPATDAKLSNANHCFLEKDLVRIAPDDRGFTFGDGIYEVLKAYRANLFKIERHLERLGRSLAAINLPKFELKSLHPIINELLVRNELKECDAKIYIQITRGCAPRDHAFPSAKTPLTVFISTTSVQSKSELLKNGAKAILVDDFRWGRCDIKQIGLLAGVLANQKAKEADAYEAIFVRNGKITEGTHTNFCALINNKLHTHPANNHILSGITRAVVIDICSDLKIPVIEEPIAVNYLLDEIRADSTLIECLVLGTITEIMPIIQLNDHIIGSGKPGPLSRQLQQQFNRITQS